MRRLRTTRAGCLNLGAALLLVPCLGADAPAAGLPVTKTTYTYASAGTLAIEADVYSPLRSPYGLRRPVVVFVHGGGWACGNRDAFVDLPRSLAQAYGVVTVTASYRLAPMTDGVVVDGHLVAPGAFDGCPQDSAPGGALGLPDSRQPFPAALNDLRELMRQLRRHAADLRIDARRIAVVGASAGGHLVGLLGTAEATGLPAAAGDRAREVDAPPLAIVSIAGPWNLAATDDTDPSIPGMLRNLFNGDPSPAQLQAASPLTHAGAPAFPPTLFLHGEADSLVPASQSIAACAAMPRCAGGAPLLVAVPPGANPHDALTLLQARWPEFIAFLGAVFDTSAAGTGAAPAAVSPPASRGAPSR